MPSAVEHGSSASQRVRGSKAAMVLRSPAPQGVRGAISCPGRFIARPPHKAGYVAVALLLLPFSAAVIQRAGTVVRDQCGDVLYQRTLGRITAQINQVPPDPRRSVRLAPLYLARARLLATIAYERQHRIALRGPVEPGGDVREYADWCSRYLAADPAHAVTDTLRVTRLALRQSASRSKRHDLLVILATTLCYLGHHHEELAALRQAKPLAPDPSNFDGRLIHAYAEVGQLRQAQAARNIWEQHLPKRTAPPAVPPGQEATGAGGIPTTEGG
jgi:hypothetical protein